jgi:hypothetical protein
MRLPMCLAGGVNMLLHASGFLLLGALFGRFLRLPAFMLLVVLTLAAYGFAQRDDRLLDVGWDLLVALLALQCGYALMIIFQLLSSGGRRRASHNARGGSEQDGPRSGTGAQ